MQGAEVFPTVETYRRNGVELPTARTSRFGTCRASSPELCAREPGSSGLPSWGPSSQSLLMRPMNVLGVPFAG